MELPVPSSFWWGFGVLEVQPWSFLMALCGFPLVSLRIGHGCGERTRVISRPTSAGIGPFQKVALRA